MCPAVIVLPPVVMVVVVSQVESISTRSGTNEYWQEESVFTVFVEEGQVTVKEGAGTVKIKVHMAELPSASVAVATAAMLPMLSSAPERGEKAIDGVPQLSEPVMPV